MASTERMTSSGLSDFFRELRDSEMPLSVIMVPSRVRRVLPETAQIYYAHVLENGTEAGCQLCDELSGLGMD